MVGAWEAGIVYECGFQSCYSDNDVASIIFQHYAMHNPTFCS